MKKVENQHHHTAASERRARFKVVLQFFVWVLIIAFVSTIGVTWDSQAGGIPVVIESSKGSVDLSPNSIFSLEYQRSEQEYQEYRSNLDPRDYIREVQNIALTNAANIFAKTLFYKDIKLNTSRDILLSYINNYNVTSNVAEYIYGERQMLDNALGVLPIISSPTPQDLYNLNELDNLKLAVEILVLNKTNFLLAQLTEAEKQEYFDRNFMSWVDSVTLQEFQATNRGQARKISTLLKDKGVVEALQEIKTNAEYKNVVITEGKTLTAMSDYNYFTEALNTIKENKDQSPIISKPLYINGGYKVLIVNPLGSITNLPQATLQRMSFAMVIENFNTLSRKYSGAWNQAIRSMTQMAATDDNISQMMLNLKGAQNHLTQPFSLAQASINTIFGTPLVGLPLLSDKQMISALLDTPIGEKSAVLHSKAYNDLYIVVAPTERTYKPTTNTAQLITDPNAYRNAFQYKVSKLQESQSYETLKHKFNIKLISQNLTNLNPMN